MRVDGVYAPHSATFRSDIAFPTYTWTSEVPEYSAEQLQQAVPISDETYLGVPSNLPPRIIELARRITADHSGVYDKARAIEHFLQTEYVYRFADAQTSLPPDGQDPIDWFLFDHREGTAGQFSSAFVLLARSVGVPARVASGWAIAQVGVEQPVASDQAHQWAEVGFEALGWIGFEPTGPDGPLSRAGSRDVWEAELARLSAILLTDPYPNRRIEAAEDLARFSRKAPLPVTLVTEPLTRSLGSDVDDSVRSAAARALGVVDDVSVMGPLAGAVTSDTAALVRMTAILALAKTGREGAIAGISPSLLDTHVEVLETVEEALADLGAEVIALETGGRVVREDDEIRAILVGVTTAHASEPPHNPVFRVHGAGETRYLRTAVGDIYENGSWSQTPPVEIPFRHNSHVQRLVDRELPTYLGNDPDQNLHSETASLAWPVNSIQSWGGLDRITVAPASASGLIPAGVWPISLNPIYIFSPGSYRPFSATFRSETSRPEYSWSAKKSVFITEQLMQAQPVGDDYSTQLPDNLPSRVRQLAGDVTAGHATAYLKAKAIEAFLREYYSYGFADPDSPHPPIDRDPVDWFLFEQRRGTCAQFSSAFVVLARAAGIPARVVSGWVVSPQDDWQTIHTDQAHQWAEVAFDRLGWVTFDPTAPDGAPERTPGFGLGGSEPLESIINPEEKSELEGMAADNPNLINMIEDRLANNEQPGLTADASVEENLDALGAEVTGLENGGALVDFGDSALFVGGTTTD